MLYIKVHVNLVLLPAVSLIFNSQYITGMQDLEKVAGGIHIVDDVSDIAPFFLVLLPAVFLTFPNI